jgi:hypothetical protein
LFASDVRLLLVAAKYFVAFVVVNLFACVVVLFCGFCFGSKDSKEEKKGFEEHRSECVCESVS